MANLDTLPAFLRSKGLTVVETPGWITRGYAGQDLIEVRGNLWHHTATNRLQFTNDAPTLNMCIGGRPDLPGPLCNIVFGRSGTVYMIATGVANHAGYGSAPGIPKDMGNHYLIGIEMESSGIKPWDWTDDQIRIAPHLGAAIEEWGMQHLPPEQRLQLGHMEYSSQGKIDPAGWPGGMDGLRASINKILAGGIAAQGSVTTTTTAPAPVTEEEEDMATPTITLMREPNGKIWATQDFVSKWHVPDPSWITHYQNVEKWGWLKLRRDNKGNHIHNMPAFGGEIDAPIAPGK